MEPTLLGPQRLAYCESCQQTKRFYADSISERRPTRCPQCGIHVTCEGWQDGEEVQVVRLDRRKQTFRRGEIVVLRESNTDKLEVKRVVGLPYESLKFIDGDLWVDGRIFQKSMPQFLSQAIEVDRWPEIEGTLRAIPGDVPIVHHFQYLSLWPQVNQELQAHPSPILDEYQSNAAESRRLIPVRDIGLKLAFSPEIVRPVKMEIQLWVNDAIRRVHITLTSAEISLKKESMQIRDVQSSKSTIIPWSSDHSRSIIVAMVDGRMLVGNERYFQPISISDLDDNSEASEAHNCSADTPITLAILDGELSIVQAIVVRDIHYRGWHGVGAFTLPATSSYHVLGDNVSNSGDSRQRWPDGVSPNWIIGRVLLANRIRPEL